MSKSKAIILSLVLGLLLIITFTIPAQADIGVGIDLARINVDDPLIPGETYHLPLISVINTGTQACDYGIDISSISDQTQLAPPAEWFSLEPGIIHLQPGDNQQIEISLTIPFKAKSGEYFALVESSPRSTGGSAVAVGIAAATKLYFSVKPANFITSLMVKIPFWIENTFPFFYLVSGAVITCVLVFFFLKYFRFRFKLERK